MNVLTTIIVVIASIIVLMLVLALFVRKGYTISRQIIIDKPNQQVFDYIKHLKNQDFFSKWVMTDPNMKKEFKGVDGTVGFVYSWSGNKKAGEGNQEIMNIVEGKKVDIEVRFVRPFTAVASTPFETEATSSNQTKVTWGMSSKMNYPMNIILLFLNMESLLGKDMDTSLGNLKTILEKS